MNCPRCQSKLQTVKSEYGPVLMCMDCFGHASPVNFLSRLVTDRVWHELLRKSTDAPVKNFSCPNCETITQTRRFHFQHCYVDLDLCEPCSLLWFDKNEIEEFPVRVRNTLGAVPGRDGFPGVGNSGVPLDPDAKAQLLLARLKLEQMERLARNRARYWRLQRIINTPWMLNSIAQSLTGYSEMDDFFSD